MHKISVTIFSFNKYFIDKKMTIEEFIKYCADLGVDAVDLGYFWADEEKEITLVSNWLEQYKISLGAYIVRNDFARKETKERDKEIAKVEHAIDRAKQLRTNIVRIFAGDTKEGFKSYSEAKDILVECFNEVCKYAHQKDIILALENHGKLCGRAEEIIDLLGAVSSDNLKLTIDIGNFLVVNENPVEAIKKLVHLCVHTHMKDYKKIDRGISPAILGEGDVPLKECLRVFKQSNYQGYLSIEYEAAEDSKVGVERSYTNLKRALVEIGL